MDQPFISIIIPTCNRPADLRKCLNALVAQAEPHSDIELIVCDDSKNEDSKTVVEREFPSIQWHQGPQRGPARNRNSGAKIAKGEWLIFIDDDCLPRPSLISAYKNEMRKASVGERVALEGPTFRIGEPPSLLWEAPHNPTGGILISCNFAIPRALFWEVGGFDERYPIAFFEDTEFAARLELNEAKTRFVEAAAVDHPLRPLPPPAKLARRWESRVISTYDFGAKPWQVMVYLPRHVLLVILSRFRGQKWNKSNLKAIFLFASEFFIFLRSLPYWCRRYGQLPRSTFWTHPSHIADRPRRFGL